MIPSIQILGERVHRLLKQGDVMRDSQWDDRDLEYLIRDSTAKAIKASWYETRNAGNKNIDGRFATAFSVEVQKTSLGENYIDIPVSNWVILPDDAGIESVRPDLESVTTKKTKEDEFRAFIPIPSRFQDLYFTLPAGSLEGQFGWMIRGQKIVFTKKFGKTVLETGFKKVIVDIVSVDPAAVPIDKPLPIGQDMILDVMTGVLQLLGLSEQRAKDLVNNENPNR